MKGDDISERLVGFSVRVIRLITSLPKNFVGKHVSNQLLRSGTSPGANYEEARGAESSADFIHKLRIVLKELRETLYWLKVIKKGELLHSFDILCAEFCQLPGVGEGYTHQVYHRKSSQPAVNTFSFTKPLCTVRSAGV